MTIDQLVFALAPLANSKVAASAVPAILSGLIGAISALSVFWWKSREPLTGSIAWQWQHYPNGQATEEPFLAIQNQSDMPGFIIRARLLRGNFIKREVARYAFSYDEITDGSFPLEIAARGVSMFPLSRSYADKIIGQAGWFNKVIGYLLKRPFLWVEVKTMTGRSIVVAANDATNFQERPLWVDLRWFPPPKPLWMP